MAESLTSNGSALAESARLSARQARRERLMFLSLSVPSLVLVAVGALLPLLWLVRQSFLTLAGGFTLENHALMLSSSSTYAAIGTTLQLSLGTLLICLLLGVPLSLALASTSTKVANRLLMLIMLPLWTSILVRTYAWLVLLKRDGVVNTALLQGGLVSEPLPLVYNYTGTLIGMVHYMLPLFVLPTYAAMRDIDRSLVLAAASLGASLWRTVWTVILPLSLGGIVSGSIIVFVYTLGFFITPAILGGGQVSPIAIRIERTLATFQNWGAASALGILLFLMVAIFGITLQALSRTVRGRAAEGRQHA